MATLRPYHGNNYRIFILSGATDAFLFIIGRHVFSATCFGKDNAVI